MNATPKITRREKEKLRHRREIMDAACKVFNNQGYAKTTINDISELSEFSIASIYKHFTSKEDIYYSLLEENLKDYLVVLFNTTHIASPLARLKACIYATFQLNQENSTFAEFIVKEGRLFYSPETINVDTLREIYTQIAHFYTDLFQKAIDQGELIHVNPIYLAISLLANIYFFMIYSFMFTNMAPINVEEFTTIFFNKITTS